MPINISASVSVFRWRPACWLRVTGEDAAIFLQGQFTNDLRGVPAGSAVYGLWLTLKGKVMADSFVLRGHGPNEFWIGSYFSAASTIRERLESHIIADDVVIEDLTVEWEGISVVGAGAGQLLSEPPADAFVFRGRRDRGENVEWLHRSAVGEPVWLAEVTTNRFLENEHVAYRRIAEGIPAVPLDVGPADLPNEAGLEADAISYTKGCYLGQEVMARLKSMGQVRRRLIRVGGAGGVAPTTPTALFAGGRQIGELRSAVRDVAGGWVGLAMVSLLHVTPGVKLALAVEAEPGVNLLDTL